MDKEVADLSGVYMRSLVKKISSSKVRNLETANGFCQGGNLVNGVQGSSEVVKPLPQSQQPSPQPQQHKKKVRRRLHTSRPYQERLLNMAEARREIVTALKFHRASMKQQQQQEQPLQLVQQPPLQILSHPSPDLEPKAEMNPISSKSPMKYPSDGVFHRSPSFTYDSSSNHMFYPNVPIQSVSSLDHPSFSFPLPSQTLGLNLNFQDLSNLNTSSFQNNPSLLFASPSSSSSSPALSSTTTDEIYSTAEDSHNGAPFLVSQPENVGGYEELPPYPAMDSEVMKEIKSVGDCYDMALNDTMNSMTTAWWFEFSKVTETRPEDHLLSQLSEHPSWFSPADSYFQPNLNIACPQDSSPDPTLPRLDIGEIDGMDGDWFA